MIDAIESFRKVNQDHNGDQFFVHSFQNIIRNF